MIREISKIVVGAGLLSMLLGYGARGDDKGLPGPINSVEDLQDAGKMLFKLADTNNDNLISQKEAIDAGNLLFGGFFFRADTNGDGKLTPDELRGTRGPVQPETLAPVHLSEDQRRGQSAGQPSRSQFGEAEVDKPTGHEPRQHPLGCRIAPGSPVRRSESVPDGRRE